MNSIIETLIHFPSGLAGGKSEAGYSACRPGHKIANPSGARKVQPGDLAVHPGRLGAARWGQDPSAHQNTECARVVIMVAGDKLSSVGTAPEASWRLLVRFRRPQGE